MNNETELKPCPFCKTKKVQALNGIVHHTKVVGGKSCPLTWLEVDEKYWQNRPIEDAKDAEKRCRVNATKIIEQGVE
jgi:hypothetical protein